MLIRGNDGGSAITAVTFDMSQAGRATFNEGIVCKSSTGGDFGVNLNTASGDSLKLQVVDTGTGSAANGVITATDGDIILTPSTGFVGIGTTAPENVIHLKGTNNSAGDLGTEVGPGNIPGIVVQNAGTTDNNLGALFFMDDASVRAGVHARFTSHGSDNAQLRLSTSSGGNLRERMVIGETGNVAISDRGPPLAHYTGYIALDIGDALSLFSNNTSTNIATLTNNGYLNSNASNWIYKFTDEATMYSQVHGDHRFSTAPSGSADAAITWSEKVRIQNTGGISFNGDTAAANALDDYEEGSWTPVASTSNNNSTINTTVNFAKYIKVGGLVHVSCYLSLDIDAIGTGAAIINGLPFTATSGQGYSLGIVAHATAISSSSTHGISAYVTNGHSNVRMVGVTDAANPAWVAGDPKYIMIDATYHHV